MSAHWRLALQYAAWVLVGALVLSVVVWGSFGVSYAVGFGYGVVVGVLCMVSTALTVSLLTGVMTGGSAGRGVAIGAASFVGRLGFAAGALAIPAYLELWPVVAMLIGFAGVYVAENVALVLGTPKFEGFVRVGHDEERAVDEGAERKVEV